MKRYGKVLLPLLVLAAGALAARAIIAARPAPQRQEPTAAVPLVRVMEAQPTSHRFRVQAQGTVMARTESALTAEVAGRVVTVAAGFADGGFFDKDDVLLTIEDSDHRALVAQAQANVAAAELRLAREEEEARVARREWESLGQTGEPTALVLRKPQLAEARANVAAAGASLSKAQRDLRRTRVRAPFQGRVRRTQVDVGSFVAPGTPVATIYSVDVAEVRLPLPDEQLAYIQLPLSYRDTAAPVHNAPEVLLHATFAGQSHTWHGALVRTEGEIDPRTRMVTAVAQVTDPYGRDQQSQRPPLAVGMFVHAEILGRRVEGVFVVPRSALRGENQLLVVDEGNRLRVRTVDVMRATREHAIVGAGLEQGERICLSKPETVVDGMPVRVVSEAEVSAESASSGGEETAR